MAKHPERKGGYFCAGGTVVPPLELQQMVFLFVEKTKIEMPTLIAKGVYRPTAMGFINMLKHLRVVILQDAAEMLIAGHTHYLFMHEMFSCELFKEFVKVMMTALETVVEEEKSSYVFGEALENNINKFHHTIDAGLKKIASHIKSTKMTSRIQHKTVMKELCVLVTKSDIQKAMNAMLPAKRHKTGRGETSSIHPRTLCTQVLLTDISDRANPPSDHDEDTVGDDAQEETLVQEDSMEYILGDIGLPIGWLTYKYSFMETKYGGNVSDLWKAWHEEVLM
jgi:hypothetical protein